MANIKVNNLRAISTELLINSESFMNKLSHNELNLVLGGIRPGPPPPTPSNDPLDDVR